RGAQAGSVCRMMRIAAALLLAVACLVARTAAADPSAGFVGAQACAGCHAAETAAWHGSQHDQAMQAATPDTVLGNFDDATVTQFGVTSRFYRKGAKFWTRTEGPDGALHDYRI